MATKRDYYEILGVGKRATSEELKKAYRKKALEYHPDRNKAADAEERFKEVNEAYEVLANPEKRRAYDQFGHAAFDPRSGFSGGFGDARSGRAGPFTYSFYSSGGGGPSVDFGFGDFSDPFEIFESFFGGATPFRREPAKPRYGLTIEFMEAMKGAEKTVVVNGKSHTIKIPPGADEGTRIRYQDFDVTLDVRPNPRFKRDGADLFVDQLISFATAALGGKVEVPSIEGPLSIRVRPGTQPGALLRLSGSGAPKLNGRGRGDLYVRFLVEVPKTLSRRQKELLGGFDEG